MNPLVSWFSARFQERSTWAAVLTAGATIAGAAIAPDRAEAITTVGMLVAGAVGVATREGPKP